jgi:flagellar basal-body rod protein FlgG
MPKGIYAAASAMVVETRSLEVTARNLAHVQTPGYRRETALRTSFAEVMSRQGYTGDVSRDGGVGLLPAGSYFTFQDGTIVPTGAPLDLALTGNGFYQVRDDQGRTVLTRAAHFNTDVQGRLVTPEGWTVEGQGGAITIPADATRVVVDPAGRIIAETQANGQIQQTVIDQLRVVTVAKPERLSARNGQYFDPDGQALGEADRFEVHQGNLEQANLDPIQELAQLIALQRRYDAAQHALREQANTGASLSEILRGT